jgi:hypothetical protein
MSEKKLKAYTLACHDEDHGASVVFAADAKQAKKMHHDERCDCEYIDRTVGRQPLFDHFAPGPMTPLMYLSVPDARWAFPCQHCDSQLFSDAGAIAAGEWVYCNRECLLADRERVAAYITENGRVHKSFHDHIAALDAWLAANPEPASRPATPEEE